MAATRHPAGLGRYLLLATAAVPAVGAHAASITPSIETRLVGSYDSEAPSEKRAWSELGAGVRGELDKERVDLNLQYRYARRFGISGEVDDNDRHTGSGLLRSELIRDLFYLDAQGAATILNTQFAGETDPDADDANQQQTFSASVQPALRRRFGRLLANLRYSYGIFEAEGRTSPLRIGEPFSPNQSLVSGASDTRNQSASLSLGNAGRSDRLRWRVVGEYQRDRIEQLDQLYRSKRALADGEYSLSRSIGLIGSVGYEDILDRQDTLLIDATGAPILDANGLLQRDPANPITVNFDESGPTFEGGVRYSPSRRTNLIVRAGRRFGDFTASGSLDLRLSRGIQLFATYTESINNFGRLFTTLFTDPVSGAITPVSSYASGGQRAPLGSSTCAFGLDAATGFCRFNLTQVATNATFKDQSAALTIARGANAVEEGPPLRFTGSVSGFFTRRSYLGRQPAGIPAGGAPLSLGGAVDTSYGVNLQAAQQLGDRSNITFDLRGQRNEYGLSRDGKDVFVTAQLRYDMDLGQNLGLFATAFASRRWVKEGAGGATASRLDLPDRTAGTVSIGVRYSFNPNRGRGASSAPSLEAPEG